MDVTTLSDDALAVLLPYPAADANKYTRGKLMLLAGCAAYPGAACLAAYAACRLGAGYVEVICDAESVPIVRGIHPSLVVRSWQDCNYRELVCRHAEYPLAHVVGSGFDANDTFAQSLALCAFRDAQEPLLCDGGAISALATAEGIDAAHVRSEKGWPLVVTPHEAEATRLEQAARITPAVDAQSAARACALAQAYRCIVVLKGSDTYISDGMRTVLVDQGTAALAKAGTGDVLAGMIGALLAQGTDPFDAAVLGATLHAKAGCAAAAVLSDISVTSEDLIEYIPCAIREIGKSDRK